MIVQLCNKSFMESFQAKAQHERDERWFREWWCTNTFLLTITKIVFLHNQSDWSDISVFSPPTKNLYTERLSDFFSFFLFVSPCSWTKQSMLWRRRCLINHSEKYNVPHTEVKGQGKTQRRRRLMRSWREKRLFMGLKTEVGCSCSVEKSRGSFLSARPWRSKVREQSGGAPAAAHNKHWEGGRGWWVRWELGSEMMMGRMCAESRSKHRFLGGVWSSTTGKVTVCSQ